MKLPDLTDEVKMAHIGRMTVLRKARKDAARKLRDKLIPLLNSIEGQDAAWDVSGIVEMVSEIQEISNAIADLN